MKIAVITFWHSNDNYGQQLQCFALQKYFLLNGDEPLLIRFWSTEPFDVKKRKWKKVLNPIKVIRFISGRCKSHYMQKKDRLRDFPEFRRRYLIQSKDFYSSARQLQENPPQADVYCVGSDQVWNPNWMKPDAVPAYFLGFGDPKARRISYAASFGVTELLPETQKIYASALKKLNAVSVREQSATELCRICGREDAQWVLDPTMLIDPSVYRAVYKENRFEKPKKPYVLLYLLSNSCEFSLRKFYSWAKSKNFDVVYITGNSRFDLHKKTYATVPQWLGLIDHAEAVFTNSYHCCVFSLLFRKNFSAVPLTSSHQMNTRIDSLFEIFGIEPRWFDGDFSKIETPYQINEAEFSRMQKISFDFLAPPPPSVQIN